MIDNVANRERIIEDLYKELVGPDPRGTPLDITKPIVFDQPAEARGPFRQASDGDEILVRDSPTKRYGIGVLFPMGEPLVEEPPSVAPEVDVAESAATTEAVPSAEFEGDIGREAPAERDTDDFDLSLANAYQPSSMGVSFLAEFPPDSNLLCRAAGGRYHPFDVQIGRETSVTSRRWWARRPVTLQAKFAADIILGSSGKSLTASPRAGGGNFAHEHEVNTDDLDLRIEVFARPWRDEPRLRLVTVCLVNRTRSKHGQSSASICLFQTELRITIESPGGNRLIHPYPAPPSGLDAEQDELALLYRKMQTFGTGHGCAADWIAEPGDDRASEVLAACLPTVTTSAITPDITREDGSVIAVPMAALAGLLPENDGRAALKEIVDRYEAWIGQRRAEASGPALPSRYWDAADRHLRQCERALGRMRRGLRYLEENAVAHRAFQLANHAILLQQLITRDSERAIGVTGQPPAYTFSEPYHEPDPLAPPENRGTWRAFQIAFLLSSIRSAAEDTAVDDDDPEKRDERDVVELIWFPTGGGKTEAYLGLAAFAVFKRRLEDPGDSGTHVLMRYTLRLLTAQQFQRASGLLCSMEHIRKAVEATQPGTLGDKRFSIGIWVGGETTPNTRQRALTSLSKFRSDRIERNPFLLTRCPWCGAQFRRIRQETQQRRGGKPRALILTPGYERYTTNKGHETVVFRCPDQRCPFSSKAEGSVGLPIKVIDDDIYDEPPTLVIGTVDKFATLAWRPQARSIFGLNEHGDRECSPPGLIIQDELHLIAGPLGSMAGLYETVVEDLCTDHRGVRPVRPKIVSSTATIRRYADQVDSLYARQDVVLFPPPGLDAGDSFFARYDLEQPGRIYVGVHAVSLGSVQTEWVRTLTALLQAPMSLPSEERDPWWTMLVFFNSIREMGTAHTLFQSDVPDYARVIWNRRGVQRENQRFLNRVLELTGGLTSGEVSDAMRKLETRYTGRPPYPLDVCLASSIIEVGIDIQRLALMVVAGQPKTTSQYIQVTGRVGRQKDRPGLVVTMYSPSKPRDRSHFERFRSYHERLYANVEPTSVTPFSPPALERALHAVMVTHARQSGDEAVAESPYPFPEEVINRFGQLLLARVERVDAAERQNALRVLETRIREWKRRQRHRWSGVGEDDEIPLMRPAGAYATLEEQQLSWSTPTSMRNVDAECVAHITTAYLGDDDDDDDGMDLTYE